MSTPNTDDTADASCEPQDRMLQDKKLECLTTMASGVAHDFNNYLTAIIGNNSIILENLPEDSRVLMNARQIASTAQMALNLTNEIIFYTARARRTLTGLDIAALVNGMQDEIKSNLCRHVDVEYHLNPTDLVRGDADQIRMIVHNIVENATDALVDREEGRITVESGTVEVDDAYRLSTYQGSELPTGRYVYIDVQDNGKGIPPDVRERMFDPFFSTKLRGRGMGLPVVTGILRAHRGMIRMETRLNQGTNVRVLLPCFKDG